MITPVVFCSRKVPVASWVNLPCSLSVGNTTSSCSRVKQSAIAVTHHPNDLRVGSFDPHDSNRNSTSLALVLQRWVRITFIQCCHTFDCFFLGLLSSFLRPCHSTWNSTFLVGQPRGWIVGSVPSCSCHHCPPIFLPTIHLARNIFRAS